MEDEFTIFADVWIKLTGDLGRVISFNNMGRLGLASATAQVHANNIEFIEQGLKSDDFKHFLKDPEVFFRDGHDKALIQAMTQAAVGSFEQSLDAASLVFAHSILDAALHDCLRISALAAPEDWMQFVGKRNVALNEIGKKSSAEHLREAIAGELDRLERESLLKKVDRLFQLCKPKKQIYLTNGFRFDRDRLKELDNLRHAIVHAPEYELQFSRLLEDLDFLRKSGLHIAVMIADTYNTGLNGQEVVAAYQRRNSAVVGTR